jgi:quercetin dioxygenase-like cupin family protein
MPEARIPVPRPPASLPAENSWSYSKFKGEEGLPTVMGHHVGDVAELALAPWARMGGRGTFINLGDQEFTDAYVVEIAAGASLAPQRHLFEEIIYVIDGHGTTTVTHGGMKPVSIEWRAGSLFAIPLNARYQHHNLDRGAPARLFAATDAPLMVNIFRSRAFTFGCPYEFTDRFRGNAQEFESEPELMGGVPGNLYELNFVADIRSVQLSEWSLLGYGVRHAYLAVTASVMKVHLAEFAVGTYGKAQVHGPGTYILILEGTGYSLLWPPGGQPERHEWRPGSLLSPPAGWYRQHFNTGTRPALHLAFHRPAPIFNKSDRGEAAYEDEDLAIWEEFARALRKNGVANAMPKLSRTQA